MLKNDFYPLRKAAAALKSIETGIAKGCLRRAARFDLWLPVRNRFGLLVLWGEAVEHPMLGGDDIVTSPVVALDLDEGWARTCGRLYRLGRNHPAQIPAAPRNLVSRRRGGDLA